MTDRDDPFAVLGLSRSATADDVRSARRRLAKDHHPDAGGDAESMRAINAASAAALRSIDCATTETVTAEAPDQGWSRTATDAPSFTVEALPAETFEALVVVASWIGEVVDDDPPYRLETRLDDPVRCWCRLDVVADAGSSTVSITVAFAPGVEPIDVERVRDVWIANLNVLEWS